MKPDGKWLEKFVARIEQLFLPAGCRIDTTVLAYSDDGEQVAEFDVTVRGRLGSTDIAWLIECRDRPSSGAAPSSWIEQLIGRRTMHGFDKVTAVSTTGFSPGASHVAERSGIELREVNDLSPEALADWLGIEALNLRRKISKLERMSLVLDDSEGPERLEAMRLLLASNPQDPILRSVRSGELVAAGLAFSRALNGLPGAFDSLEPRHAPQGVELVANYPLEDCYEVETSAGAIRVPTIVFRGLLRVEVERVPISKCREYLRSEEGGAISQVVSFESRELMGAPHEFDLVRVPESGETYLVVRRTGS